MTKRFTARIVRLLSQSDYQPLKARALARALNVPDAQYDAFRTALRQLHDEGKVFISSRRTITLPPMADRIVGIYQQRQRGFGFVRPEQRTVEGDLYIPSGENLDAVSGDRVVARVSRKTRRDGSARLTGKIVEVLDRAQSQLVGTLLRDGSQWFVEPDGREMTERISVDDPGAKNAVPGDKVLVEILSYPTQDYYAHGVILEKLGKTGTPKAELKGIIRRYNLPEKFSRSALGDTRAAIRRFNPDDLADREDIRDKTIITIDPVDARDFDDAISLTRLSTKSWELGVHIADVSYFVRADTHLDREARQRGNSVYLPGCVIPMLPELLSNGLCSLQQNQDRFAKSVYISLDSRGKVLRTRFANSIIRSTRRLTYEDAERILDGNTLGFHSRVITLLRDMERLARRLYERRLRDGMLTLSLPKAELIYDARGRVIDARPESTSFPHTMIEMFMLEANEAVARLFDSLKVPFLRRLHPEPDSLATGETARIIKLCGYVLPKNINRKGLQELLAAVKGKPESFLVNLAVLKSLQRAEYSPAPMGHYALASDHYCHFTSPIRRYPDLTVHRLLDAYLAGRLTRKTADQFPSYEELEAWAAQCNQTERNAERAENELREVKILQMLEDHIGEEMNAVVTSVTNFGIFVQCERFLIEGLIKAEDIMRQQRRDRNRDHQASSKNKSSRRSKRRTDHHGEKFSDICPYKLGQELRVRIAAVHLPARLLDLVPCNNA